MPVVVCDSSTRCSGRRAGQARFFRDKRRPRITPRTEARSSDYRRGRARSPWPPTHNGMYAGRRAAWRHGCGLKAWMNHAKILDAGRIFQNLSQTSLYLQSIPYLMVMHSSHLQTEICMEGAFKKSKMVSVRALMIIMIILIAKKSFGYVKIDTALFFSELEIVMYQET